MILSMKNKLIKLIVAAFLSFSITGCSLLGGLTGGGSGGTSEPTEVTKKVTKLSLDREKTKFDYSVGDEFENPTVIATYEDETTEDVSDKCTFSGYDMSKAGSQKVTAKYSNHTLTYTINVTEGKIAKSIDLESGYKTKYFIGDEFEKPTVIATYKDDTTEDVTDKCTFSDVDMSKEGQQEVKVTYQKFYITYRITISERYAHEQHGFYFSDYTKTIVVDEPHRFYYISKSDDSKYDNETMAVRGTQYTIEDNTIASIDNYGRIKGLKAGSTYVYCTALANNGSIFFEFRCLLTVEEKHVVELEISSYREKYYTGKEFNFLCTAIATYQTGYKEEVIPTIDSSAVNMSVPGNYNVSISYEINGTSVNVTKVVKVLDASLYTLDKTKLDYTINDYLNNYMGMTALPNKGNIKLLVIPVKFTDTDSCITNYQNVKEDINIAFFGENEEVGWRSVKTYYEEESKNIVTISGVTSNWYNSGFSSSECYDDNNITTLKQQAVEWFFTNNPSEDRKSYDSDHDGFIDGLCLIYGYPDYRTGGLEGKGASNLWAMVKTRNDQKPNANTPISDKYLWASYDCIYSSKAKALERTGKSEYTQAGMHNNSLGYMLFDTRTYIHETGHMFGLNDYYSSTEGEIYYAGHSNVQTLNFLSHDPYSLLLYGWADPYIPDQSQTITIKDFQDDHEVIMLKPTSSMTNSPFDEYILIDLYAPTGLNEFYSVDHPLYYGKESTQKDLITPGVRIWHVDSRLLTYESGYTEFTTNPNVGDGVRMCASNSYYADSESPCKEFVELELVRNNPEAELRTLSYNKWTDYFYEGDTFDMETFKKQFANGNKLDSGFDLGWTIKIEGIYKTATGYSANITVTKL